MEITETVSNRKLTVGISIVTDGELKLLTKKRYSFVWKELKGDATIYKLQIEGEKDILGVLALIYFPNESRIEIKLLSVSKENVGNKKRYEGIAGCLIAFACGESINKYGAFACVSLIPKTKLKQHYMDKYGMRDTGWQLFLDGKKLSQLLKKYEL